MQTTNKIALVYLTTRISYFMCKIAVTKIITNSNYHIVKVKEDTLKRKIHAESEVYITTKQAKFKN